MTISRQPSIVHKRCRLWRLVGADLEPRAQPCFSAAVLVHQGTPPPRQLQKDILFGSYNPKYILFPRNLCIFKETSGDSDDKKWFNTDGNSNIEAGQWIEF